MTGIHDLGGRDGFGPVPVDDDAIFHADWERRAFALSQHSSALAGFNTDAFRHGIEREDPETYLAITYFDKWIRNAERMLVEGGVLAPDSLPARLRGEPPQTVPRRTTTARPPTASGAIREPNSPPRFAGGDLVRAKADHRPIGHTRLPGYVAGRCGTIALVNGGWVYPDTNAHGRGEDPTWVYAVRFDSRDLWPDDPGGGHTVLVDLFEPYLEPA